MFYTRHYFRMVWLLILCASIPAACLAEDPPADPKPLNIFDFSHPPPAAPVPPKAATEPASQPTTEKSATQPASQQTEPATQRTARIPATKSTPGISKVKVPPPAKSAVPVVQKKLPVPSAKLLAAQAKLIDEAFGEAIHDSVTAGQKQALSKKLLSTGVDENTDPVARYALMNRAMELSISAGDLDNACSIADSIGERYLIDVPETKEDCVASIAKQPHLDRVALLQQAKAIATAALKVEQYDLATTCEEQALSSARHLGELHEVESANAFLKRIEATRTAQAQQEPAETLLLSNPDDPSANLKVGEFLCFIRGDWERGLPHLVRSKDERWGPLAAEEAQPNLNVAQQAALAAKWWSAAEKESGLAEIQIRSHAADLYDRVAPQLDGLPHALAEQRIRESDKETLIHRPINLLRLVDLTKDVVAGNWELKDGVLSCDSKLLPVIEFPYEPPEEYDYRIVFTRMTGANQVGQECVGNGHQFDWVIGSGESRICRFETIHGKSPKIGEPGCYSATRWIVNRREYVSVIKVRKSGVQAYLDGKLVCDWHTDYQDMALKRDSRLHSSRTIGLNAWDSATQFRVVEITEITGEGKRLRREKP
jgi:hypothetical protein